MRSCGLAQDIAIVVKLGIDKIFCLLCNIFLASSQWWHSKVIIIVIIEIIIYFDKGSAF